MITSMFKEFQIGHAAAIAVIMFVLVLTASAGVMRGLKREDRNEIRRPPPPGSREPLPAGRRVGRLHRMVVFPMIWMAYSSLKPDAAIFREPFALPSAGHLQFENYGRAWREVRFGDYFLNSVLVTTVSVTAIVLLGAMAGYALSRFIIRPAGVFWLFLAG